MKIRTGFVSNSSSSSFLIFVGKKEKTWKLQLGSTLQELDINDLESLIDRSVHYYDDSQFSWIAADEAREWVNQRWLSDSEKEKLLATIDRLAVDIDEQENYYFARVEYSLHDRVSQTVFRAMVEEGIIDKIYGMEG